MHIMRGCVFAPVMSVAILFCLWFYICSIYVQLCLYLWLCFHIYTLNHVVFLPLLCHWLQLVIVQLSKLWVFVCWIWTFICVWWWEASGCINNSNLLTVAGCGGMATGDHHCTVHSCARSWHRHWPHTHGGWHFNSWFWELKGRQGSRVGWGLVRGVGGEGPTSCGGWDIAIAVWLKCCHRAPRRRTQPL